MLNKSLGTSVYRRGRLVEYHDRSVGYGSSCNRQQLLLSLRKVRSVARKHSVITSRQPCYKIVSICKLCRGDTLFVSRVKSAVTNVVHYCPRKQIGILQDDAERPTQVVFFYLIYIYIVIAYLAVGNVVKSVDKIGYRRLTCSRCTDKRYLLSLRSVYGDVVKDKFILDVSKVDLVEFYLAGKSLVRRSSLCLVRMFPRPYSRAAVALDELTVSFFRIDERDVSLVCLRRFVKQLKYSLSACRSHYNRIELSGYLRYIERKLSAHIQKRYYSAHLNTADGKSRQREIARACKHQRAADYRNDNVKHVSDIAKRRHKDIGVLIRLFAVLEKRIVYLVKVRFRALFVTKYLDDLLSVHHLFYKAFGLAYRHLLTHKVFRALAADKTYRDQHYANACKHDQRHPYAGHKHSNKQRDYCDKRRIALRYALRYQLTYCVGIVGIYAHDVAVSVRIKKLDRQRLHLLEHIVADME